MGADKIDGVAGHARFGQRVTDGQREPASLGIRCGDVDAVRGARVTEQPAEPGGRLPVTRHQHEPRRLAEQQPAAAAIEGPHALARQRAERVEAAHHEAAQDVVAARDDTIDGPARRRSAPSPSAVAPEAHAVETVSTGPRTPSRAASACAGAS